MSSNSAAAPDANRTAGVPSAVPFCVRLAPVSGKPLGRHKRSRHSTMVIQTRHSFVIASLTCSFLIAIGLATSTSCGSCHQRVVQRARVSSDEVMVVHRVCGSYSGYTLSIAPSGMDTSGVADQYEPFMAGCDCYDLATQAAPPVRFTLQPRNVILVEYEVSKTWSVEKRRPTQGRFRLVYKPALPKITS